MRQPAIHQSFRVLVLFFGCCAFGSASLAQDVGGKVAPWFVERSRALGVDFVHENGARGTYFMPEIFGSGAALFDYDGDGDLDLFAVDAGVHGQRTAGFSAPLRDQPRGGQIRLWRQEADGRFLDVSAASGLSGAGQGAGNGVGYGGGVAVGDVDGDGFDDVFISGFTASSGGDSGISGSHRLYRNRGDGTFVDFTELSGLGRPEPLEWGTSALFVDFDQDHDLDLFLVRYLRYEPPLACSDQAGRPDYCGPGAFAPTVDRLYRNDGVGHGGRFVEISESAGLGVGPGKGLGATTADFDRDGRLDLYVANDGEPNRLWLQETPGHFVDRAVEFGAATDSLGRSEASMGVALGDVDGDGLADLLVSHLRGETNTFYRADPALGFLDQTVVMGLAAVSLPYTGFGVVFADLDLDADLDLVVANGGVTRGSAPASPNQASQANQDGPAGESPRDRAPDDQSAENFAADYAQPLLVFLDRQEAGRHRFERDTQQTGELSSEVAVGRGLVAGDLDDDGDVDLVLTTSGGRLRIFENRLEQRHPRRSWLQVAVRERSGGVAELATVTVGSRGVRQTRDVLRGQSYLSSQDPRLAFGLGDLADPSVKTESTGPDPRRVDEIAVRWRDGRAVRYLDVPVDRRLVVTP